MVKCWVIQQLTPSRLPRLILDSIVSITPGQPTEQLQVEEPREDEVQYPTGPQLWLNIGAMMLVSFLHGLDMTIVAPTVPSLTNEFKTVADIGWYSAVYGIVMSATNFFFGKMYTLFPLKKVYIASVATFEIGSALCTFAPTSTSFILGRAIAGLGAGGLGTGVMAFIPRSFPLQKRPMMTGVMGFAQSLGLISAPALGGALIDAFSWRVCYGINLPLGVIAASLPFPEKLPRFRQNHCFIAPLTTIQANGDPQILVSVFFMKDQSSHPDLTLPMAVKLIKLDPIGTILVLPCIVCLMLALIWGGTKFAWNDWRVILLFVLSAVVSIGFGFAQHKKGENALMPPRILKNRTVLASALFSCCT